MRKSVRLPRYRVRKGKAKSMAMTWMRPWAERMPPIARVGKSNPPVNLKGREGAVSDSGRLNRTGRSCSAEMVWLMEVSTNFDQKVLWSDLLGQNTVAHNDEVDLLGEGVGKAGVAFRDFSLMCECLRVDALDSH